MARKKKNQTNQWSIQLTDKITDIVTLQLINIDFYPKLSEETLCFNADLIAIANGKQRTYYCKNYGHGGSTDICIIKHVDMEDDRAFLRKIDAYYKTQKDEGFYEIAKQQGWNIADMDHTVTLSLEQIVDEKIAEWCDNGL